MLHLEKFGSGVREHARKLVTGTGEQPPIRKGADGQHRAAVLHLEKFGSSVREHARKLVIRTGEQPPIRKGADRNSLRRRAAILKSSAPVSENTRANLSEEPVSSRPSGRAQMDHTQPPCCILKSSAPVSENTRANSSPEPVSSRPSGRAQTEYTQPPCCILKSSVPVSENTRANSSPEPVSSRPSGRAQTEYTQPPCCILKSFRSGVREHARKLVTGTGEQPPIRKGADGPHSAAVLHLQGFIEHGETECSSFRQVGPANAARMKALQFLPRRGRNPGVTSVPLGDQFKCRVLERVQGGELIRRNSAEQRAQHIITSQVPQRDRGNNFVKSS